MKDNLIDEDRAKQEEAAQESLELKLERIGTYYMHRPLHSSFFITPMCKHTLILNGNIFLHLDMGLQSMSTRFSRLMAEYSSFQVKTKQRLTKLERPYDAGNSEHS